MCGICGVRGQQVDEPLLRRMTGAMVHRGPDDEGRYLVVGDAAGLTKPTTGGGIYYSLLSAELAASVACQALQAGDYSADFLSHYERAWRTQLGSELKWGSWFRRYAERLTDAQIDEAFRIAALEPLDRLIRERATFNWHGELIQALVRNGQVRSFVLRVLLSRSLQFVKRGDAQAALTFPDVLSEERPEGSFSA